MTEPLREHLQPPDLTDTGNVEAITARLEARPARRRRRAVTLGALAVAAAALLALIPWLAREEAPARAGLTGARLASREAPVDVELRDGSRVVLDPRSRLRVDADASETDSESRVSVFEGRATFDVTRRPSRRFVVRSGDVEVVVLGTRFSVERQGALTVVEVERGRVEVDDSRGSRVLTAGESWRSEPLEASAEPRRMQLEPQVFEPEPEPARRRARRRAPEPAPVDPAAALLADGTAAANAHRYREAADAYARLLAEHPRDRRAGLAAYHLGRLRMDRLGDPAGGAQALRTALTRTLRSSYREDAMARLVEAYDRTGSPACAGARERYLASYPSGTHASDVRERCR